MKKNQETTSPNSAETPIDTNQDALTKKSEAKLKRKKDKEIKRYESLPIESKIDLIAREQRQSADWVQLDNAALIFPASETIDRMNMFRLSVVLKDKVDPLALQRAVNMIVPRFPTIATSVKRGLFWCYLEPSNTPIVVREQREFPCRKLALDSRNSLFRVTYFNYEISVEFFHVASDANGGIVFLNTLLDAYFEVLGYETVDRTNTLSYRDKPNEEEMVDAYQQYHDGVTPKKTKDVKSYVLKGNRLDSNMLILTKGVCNSDDLRRVAKSRGMSVGELLSSCITYAIEQEREFCLGDKKHPVVVSVPVDMRRIFPSKTLRNFAVLFRIYSDGLRSFDETCELVKKAYVEGVKEDYLQGYVNFNVASQNNPLIRYLPLPIKMLGMRVALNMYDNNVSTTTISNLGIIKAPEDYKDRILRYEFSLGAKKTELSNLAIATFNGTTVMTFSRVIDSALVEKYFFRHLSALGVDVVIETNYQGDLI